MVKDPVLLCEFTISPLFPLAYGDLVGSASALFVTNATTIKNANVATTIVLLILLHCSSVMGKLLSLASPDTPVLISTPDACIYTAQSVINGPSLTFIASIELIGLRPRAVYCNNEPFNQFLFNGK